MNHAFTIEEQQHKDSEDALINFIANSSPHVQVREALLNEGYCVLSNILTPRECHDAIELIRDFILDTSQISRNDPEITDEEELATHVFRSNGAGWLLGRIREIMAERVFEPLFETRELHSSKEGFHFSCFKKERTIDQYLQEESVGVNMDNNTQSSPRISIQSMVALEDSIRFGCIPRSFQQYKEIASGKDRRLSTWVNLTDHQILRLQEELHLDVKNITMQKGDVIIWRSDLAHTRNPVSYSGFGAAAYCSMQPASFTPPHVWRQKMDAYKERRTGDHRPHVESWHYQQQKHHRQYFRTSPPILTNRLAELYGIVTYTKSIEEQNRELQRALLRGARFYPIDLPTRPKKRIPCSAKLELLTPTIASDMQGQDKYLGGMASPCGKYIYGVPGSASRVLRIRCKDGQMDCIGSEFEGKFKWLRGIEVQPGSLNDRLYPDGCCIAIPCNTLSILKINPSNNSVHTFGESTMKDCATMGGWLYHGGNLAPNGWIYAIPANAERVLKFHPRMEESLFIGQSYVGRQKWYGGIIGSDGCIYGVPHNATGVLKIDPSNDTVTVVFKDDGTELPPSHWKWHGGLRAGDKIYGFANNADDVLVVDTRRNSIYTIGDKSIIYSGRHRINKGNRYKYLGGALSLDGRYAYFFPCDAEQVLRIDCRTDELKLVGPLLLEGENKFQNGFVGRDGCLYGIPQRSSGVLRIIPPTENEPDEHIDLMDCGEHLIGVKDKFEGGVLGHDGCIYCIPLRAKVCVKIVPANFQ